METAAAPPDTLSAALPLCCLLGPLPRVCLYDACQVILPQVQEAGQADGGRRLLGRHLSVGPRLRTGLRMGPGGRGERLVQSFWGHLSPHMLHLPHILPRHSHPHTHQHPSASAPLLLPTCPSCRAAHLQEGPQCLGVPQPRARHVIVAPHLLHRGTIGPRLHGLLHHLGARRPSRPDDTRAQGRNSARCCQTPTLSRSALVLLPSCRTSARSPAPASR